MRPQLRTIALTTVYAIIFCAPLTGQGRPDMSGTWVMDMSRSETSAQSSQVAPSEPVTLVITQTSDRLTITTRVEGREEVVHYAFAVPDPADAPAEPADVRAEDDVVGTTLGVDLEEAFAKWADDDLVTTAWLDINGKAVTRTQTLSVDSTGREMTIETLLRVQHGYKGTDPSNENRLRDVYVKQDR